MGIALSIGVKFFVIMSSMPKPKAVRPNIHIIAMAVSLIKLFSLLFILLPFIFDRINDINSRKLSETDTID